MKKLLSRVFLFVSRTIALLLMSAMTDEASAAVVPVAEATPREATGRVLLGELNCTACHAATQKQAEWLSPKIAPRLADIGSRASAEWLQRHLAAPHTAMPGTTMPDVLRGNSEHAEALTHYLLSLAPVKFSRVMPDRAAVARGESLYHRIGCVACHAAGWPGQEQPDSYGGRRCRVDPVAEPGSVRGARPLPGRLLSRQ